MLSSREQKERVNGGVCVAVCVCVCGSGRVGGGVGGVGVLGSVWLP